MAEIEDMVPKVAFRAMVDRSGMSRIKMSQALGKSPNYLQSSIGQGSSPSVDLFARVANLSGFKLYAERGDERIVIVPEDKS